LGKSFAESAVGAFIGFDLLTKAVEAIGFGARLLKKRQQSSAGSQVRNPPVSGLPGVSGYRPAATTSTSAARNHYSKSRRPLIGLGAFSILAVAALTFFAIGSDNKESGQTTAPTPSSPAKQSSVPASEPLGRNWDIVSRSVVLVEADGADCGWRGSGTIILDGSYVLTNQHVSGEGECDIRVWFTDFVSEEPTKSVTAKVVVSDDEIDLAVLRLLNDAGEPFSDPSRRSLTIRAVTPMLGEKVYILGYPGLGGSTITLTSGDFSGIDLSEQIKFFKTTASMNPGVSGGAALNDKGELVGIPTAGIGADIVCEGDDECVANGSTIGLVRPASYAQDIINQIPR
jgi:S1-C subfamily serine protease